MQQRFIILHTNDLHGHIEGMARIATLVERIRAENTDIPVFYFDTGDVEERTNRLSNLTKGVALHRLLSVCGCDVATVGNGGIVVYGYKMLEAYANVADYPLLLANLLQEDGSLVPGVQPSLLVPAGELQLGLIGVTSDINGIYADFGLQTPPVVPIIQAEAAKMRKEGVQAIILLSHLGLPDDRKIAQELQDDISLIIGAHTHHLLTEGEKVGNIFITQAGEYAQHLGRLDLLWDGQHLSVQQSTIIPVTKATPPLQAVSDEYNKIEAETEPFLQAVIGELAEPLDLSFDRECGTANLMADMLRERMHAEIAVITAGAAFNASLTAGPLRRIQLWDACNSPANPGVVTMTGSQLLTIIHKGLDPEFAQDRPHPFRGQARGLMHLSGGSVRNGQVFINGQALQPERKYRVAGSDWELDTYGGYAEADWKLKPTYDMPTILREALEDYLAAHRPVSVEMGRLG